MMRRLFISSIHTGEPRSSPLRGPAQHGTEFYRSCEADTAKSANYSREETVSKPPSRWDHIKDFLKCAKSVLSLLRSCIDEIALTIVTLYALFHVAKALAH
jgi:hypothetical protein